MGNFVRVCTRASGTGSASSNFAEMRWSAAVIRSWAACSSGDMIGGVNVASSVLLSVWFGVARFIGGD